MHVYIFIYYQVEDASKTNRSTRSNKSLLEKRRVRKTSKESNEVDKKPLRLNHRRLNFSIKTTR